MVEQLLNAIRDEYRRAQSEHRNVLAELQRHHYGPWVRSMELEKQQAVMEALERICKEAQFPIGDLWEDN